MIRELKARVVGRNPCSARDPLVALLRQLSTLTRDGTLLGATLLLAALAASAQGLPGSPPNGPGPRGDRSPSQGRWWTNPVMVERLALTPDQQKRIDDIFQQSRLKLIDLNASLQKEEAMLEPLLAADRLDEAKAITQIDRVAQARAELEKANAKMLLGIRGILSVDQWKKLQPEQSKPPRSMPPGSMPPIDNSRDRGQRPPGPREGPSEDPREE